MLHLLGWPLQGALFLPTWSCHALLPGAREPEPQQASQRVSLQGAIPNQGGPHPSWKGAHSPPLSLSLSHTHSLSLSHTHTHTHTEPCWG